MSSENYNNYRKRKINAILLSSIIVVSIIATIQISSAVDSIIEIRFSNEFYIQNDMIVEGFNSTSLDFENVSIKSIPFQFEYFYMMFLNQNYRLRMLNSTQRAQWFINSGMFPLETSEILNNGGYLLTKSIGSFNTNESIKAGSVYKFRVPRGLNFFGLSGAISHFPSIYNLSSIMGDFFFSKTFYGFPRLNYYDLNTDYTKLIITINYMQFRNDSFAFDEAEIEFPDFPDFPLDYVPSYSFNITISREISFDILDWNIK